VNDLLDILAFGVVLVASVGFLGGGAIVGLVWLISALLG
jgi:hypothetical protein